MSYLMALLFVALLAAAVLRALLERDENGEVIVQFRLKRAIPWAVAALGVLILNLSFSSVDSGYCGVVTRFGQVSRTLNPGLHLVLPFAESVHYISTQTQTVKPSEQASSHDLQVVHAEVTLAYHYDPAYAGFVYTQLAGDGKDSVIVPAILEAIKSRTAQYDAQQLVAQRPAVRDGIEDFVKQRLAPYHVIAETVSITDFNFSEDYNRAIEAKVTAAQNAEKAQNDLTRIKIEAEQKIAQAQGEAEALKSQKAQITPELLELRTIEMMDKKWDGHLPETMVGGSGALPMMDVLKGRRSK